MPSFADPGQMPASEQPGAHRRVQVDLDADVSGYSQQIGAAQQQTDQLNASVDELTKKTDSLAHRAGKKLIHFSVGDFAALGAATTDAGLLEKQLGTLRATAQVTGSSMSGMKRGIQETFSEFPVARHQVVQLTEAITNMGVTAPKAVSSMTDTFTKLGGATGGNAGGLARGGIQLSRQMGTLDPNRVEKYANALLTVSRNQGVAAQGVLKFSQTIAPMAREAGMGEAAVLGIASAFQKAGASGFYAANTFNRIIGQITRLNQTGSPQVKLFSNFLGMDLSEFQKMGSVDQMASIFEQINRGGPQALDFVQRLGLGQRAVSSVHAVAQSGSLRQAVSQAMGASQGDENLNKGAKAAFSGLFNTVKDVRNEFTRLGETIGEPFLTPVTALVGAFGDFLSIVNKVVDAMGPIPSIMAATAGAASAVGGIGLMGAGAIGTLALARTAFGRGSALRRAGREGLDIGRAVRGGTTEAEAMAMNESGRRYTAGRLPMHARLAFLGGMGVARGTPQRVAEAAASPAFSAVRSGFRSAREKGMTFAAFMAARGAGSGVGESVRESSAFQQGVSHARRAGERAYQAGESAYAAGQRVGAQFEDETHVRRARAGAQRAAGSLRGMGGIRGALTRSGRFLMRSPAMLASFLIDDQTRFLRDSSLHDYERSGHDTSRVQRRTTGRPGSVGRVARGAGRLAGESVYAAGSMAATTAGRVGRLGRLGMLRRGVMATGYGLGRAGGGLLRGLGRLSGAMFSPLGLLATMVGIPLASAGISHIQGQLQAPSDVDETMNPITKYDQLLDKSSSNLARFSDSVGDAADSLSQFAHTPLKDVHITQADIQAATASDYTPTDENFGVIANLTSTRQGATKAAVNYIQSLALTHGGELTGDYFKAIQRDLVNAFGASNTGMVRNILNRYRATSSSNMSQNLDFTQLGLAAAGTAQHPNAASIFANAYGGGGAGGSNEDFKALLGAATTGIVAGTQGTGKEGTKSRLSQMFRLGAAALSGNATVENRQTFAAELGKAFGLEDTDHFFTTTHNNPVYGKPQDTTGQRFRTRSDALEAIVSDFLKTDKGKSVAQEVGIDPDSDDAIRQMLDLVNTTTGLPDRSERQDVKRLARQGGLGKFAANSDLVTNALDKSADPQARMRAVDELARHAQGASTNFAGADKALIELSDAMGGMSTSTGELIRQAANWARTMRSFQLPTMSREAQLGAAAGQARASAEAANTDTPSAETVEQARSDRKAFAQSKESYRKYMISRIKQVEQFNKNRERTNKHHQIQLAHNWRDFHLARERAQSDYYKRRSRAQESFNIQAGRRQRAHQISVQRQTADFHRQLERQADQAAQSMYDPFQRTQVKWTASSGTLIMNLEEQNKDIQRHLDQLDQLRGMGISQQTIDVLKLTSTEQDQQVDALVQNLKHNPDQAARINQLVAERRKSTGEFQEEEPSKQLREQVEDFNRRMKRSQEDFARGQRQAAADQHRMMSQMAEDFAETSKRVTHDHDQALADMKQAFEMSQEEAAQDLADSFQQYTGSFNYILAQMMELAGGKIKDYAPKAAQAIDDAIQRVYRDNKWLREGYTAPLVPAHHEAVHGTGVAGITGDMTDDEVHKALLIRNVNSYARGGKQLLAPSMNLSQDDLDSIAHLLSQHEAAGDNASVTRQALRSLIDSLKGVTTRPEGESQADTRAKLRQHYAQGGISLTEQAAVVSENGPELHLPLNGRGQDFMAGLIAKSLAQGITMAVNKQPAPESTSYTSDHSTSFDGAHIKVVASDPDKMARELADKKKLARLASPVRR